MTCVLFSDDVETDVAGWIIQGSWGRTTSSASSGARSWTDTPSGNYSNNSNTWLQTPAINVAGYTNLAVSFNHRLVYEGCSSCDDAIVEASPDGVNWTQLWIDGNADVTSWSPVSLQIPAPMTPPTVGYVRWRLDTDGSIVDDGWYVDDIVVTGFGVCP